MAIYLFILALAGQGLFHYAVRAWRNRAYPGFQVFFVLQLALVAWILSYLGEQLDPPRAEFWFLCKLCAVGLVPPSWFLFAWMYSRSRTKVGAWYAVYTWAAVLPFIVFTNEFHHLFFREIVLRNELVGLNGPVFPFHVGWNYLLLAATSILFLIDAFRRPARRAVALTLLAAGLIPWVASILNELTKDSVSGQVLFPVNPTLPSFIISTLIFAWVVFRQRLLDPRPLARDRLFNVLQDGLLVLDAEGTVVDHNESARKALGGQETLLGSRLSEADTPLRPLAMARLMVEAQDEPWEVELSWNDQLVTYDVRTLPLRDAGGQRGGWLLTMRRLDAPHMLRKLEEMGLSPREQELVEWVNQGLSNKEIAVILDIGAATVKNHLYNVFRKCKVGSRQELLRALRI